MENKNSNPARKSYMIWLLLGVLIVAVSGAVWYFSGGINQSNLKASIPTCENNPNQCAGGSHAICHDHQCLEVPGEGNDLCRIGFDEEDCGDIIVNPVENINGNFIRVGQDDDDDGYSNAYDCMPEDPNIHPGAEEIPGDGVDQNCDGIDANTGGGNENGDGGGSTENNNGDTFVWNGQTVNTNDMTAAAQEAADQALRIEITKVGGQPVNHAVLPAGGGDVMIEGTFSNNVGGVDIMLTKNGSALCSGKFSFFKKLAVVAGIAVVIVVTGGASSVGIPGFIGASAQAGASTVTIIASAAVGAVTGASAALAEDARRCGEKASVSGSSWSKEVDLDRGDKIQAIVADSDNNTAADDLNITSSGELLNPPSVRLDANRTEVAAGQDVVLAWNATQATSCSAVAGPQFNTGGATFGFQRIQQIQTNSVFTIECVGEGNGNIQRATAIVNVVNVPHTSNGMKIDQVAALYSDQGGIIMAQADPGDEPPAFDIYNGQLCNYLMPDMTCTPCPGVNHCPVIIPTASTSCPLNNPLPTVGTLNASGIAVTLNKTSMLAGEDVVVTWTNPGTVTSLDWIGLVEPGKNWPESLYPWKYTGGTASGSVTMTVPRYLLHANKVQFVYFRNNEFDEAGRSDSIPVNGLQKIPHSANGRCVQIYPYALHVAPGGSLSVTWRNSSGENAVKDWVGLVKTGERWNAPYPYLYTDGHSTGTRSYVVPSDATSIQFVYYQDDTFTELGRSTPILVGDAPPLNFNSNSSTANGNSNSANGNSNNTIGTNKGDGNSNTNAGTDDTGENSNSSNITCNKNLICDPGEINATCPTDCEPYEFPTCGNERCDNGETSASCPSDCAERNDSKESCNLDGICQKKENSDTCADCQIILDIDDGVVDLPGENVNNNNSEKTAGNDNTNMFEEEEMVGSGENENENNNPNMNVQTDNTLSSGGGEELGIQVLTDKSTYGLTPDSTTLAVKVKVMGASAENPVKVVKLALGDLPAYLSNPTFTVTDGTMQENDLGEGKYALVVSELNITSAEAELGTLNFAVSEVTAQTPVTDVQLLTGSNPFDSWYTVTVEGGPETFNFTAGRFFSLGGQASAVVPNKPGDTNEDGMVNGTDIVNMLEYIVGNLPEAVAQRVFEQGRTSCDPTQTTLDGTDLERVLQAQVGGYELPQSCP